MLFTTSKFALAIALTGAVWQTPLQAQAPATQAPAAAGQPADQTGKQRQFKDRTEYDLYEAARTATDPNVGLQKLNEWKEKYKDTDYELDRRTFYLNMYVKANQTQKAIDAAKDLLQLDPSNFTALYYIAYLTPQLATASGQPPSADALDQAQKAANSLLNGGLDKQFSADKKPAAMSDADWKKARTDIEAIAHNTLGFGAMQQKNYADAETQYRQNLASNPNSGELAYLLGNALWLQKTPEKQCEGLFFIARAATYDGAGALNPDGRKTVLDFLNKAYKAYHGSADGLDQLKQQAKTTPTAPSCTIETASAAASKKQQQEEEEAKKNPSLTLWRNIKAQLSAADGANYFNSSMKDALLPTLSGKVVKLDPETRPKTVTLALEDGTTPDAVLKFDPPLAGKVEPGTVLSFEGVPESYTTNPVIVTFKVDKDKLHGWTGKGEAPARKPPVRRRTR